MSSFFLLASAAFLVALHFGTIASLEDLSRVPGMPQLAPATLMAPFLALLCAIGYFSSCLVAIGSLFLAKDLELIFASPLSRLTLATGRLIETSISANWVGAVLVLPILLGFGVHFEAPRTFALACALCIISVALCASALGTITVSVLTLVAPARRLREFFILAGIVSIVAVYYLLQFVLPQSASLEEVRSAFAVAQSSAMPGGIPGPVSLAAGSLEAAITGNWHGAVGPGLQLVILAAALFGMSILFVRLTHERSWGKSQAAGSSAPIRSRRAEHALRAALFLLDATSRALVIKELRLFLRDAVQILQLVVLIGLCAIYLSNFQMLSRVSEFTEETRLWWEAFLVIINMMVGTFVVAAVATRFVYPSISYEGQSFWIIAKAPLGAQKILRAKFVFWFIPLGFIASVVLTSGALAIGAEPRLILVSALSGWIISYGIVGIAVGLGAVYANFSWEHMGQVSASVGGFLTMIAATVLILVSMIPLAFLVAMRTLRAMNYEFGDVAWYSSVTSAAAFLVVVNFGSARWAAWIGARSISGNGA